MASTQPSFLFPRLLQRLIAVSDKSGDRSGVDRSLLDFIVCVTAGFQWGRGCRSCSPPAVVGIVLPALLQSWTCRPAASALWSSSRCRWRVTWDTTHECYWEFMCEMHVCITSILWSNGKLQPTWSILLTQKAADRQNLQSFQVRLLCVWYCTWLCIRAVYWQHSGDTIHIRILSDMT